MKCDVIKKRAHIRSDKKVRQILNLCNNLSNLYFRLFDIQLRQISRKFHTKQKLL